MPLDPSIYGQLDTQAPVRLSQMITQQMDPAPRMQQMLQLRSMLDADRMNQFKMRQAEQEYADAQGQRDVYRQYGDDAAALPGALMKAGYGKQALDIQKAQQEATKTQAETGLANARTESAKLEAGIKRAERIAQIAGSATDPAKYEVAKQIIAREFSGAETEMPAQFDPQWVEGLRDSMITAHQRMTHALEQQKLAETGRHNTAMEKNAAGQLSATLRGQNMTDARGREANRLKADEIAQGGKPPPGYRWKGDGTLEAIAGGPGDKLPEAQQKQVVGVQNLSNAIKEYRDELKGFGAFDALSPDSRATMGTKYNNMLLQAKEAYNLGVLNGPDYQILQSVVTDPRSAKGVITSKSALDAQAAELDRIMTGIGATSSQRRPQDAKPKPVATQTGVSPYSDAAKEQRYQAWKKSQGL